LKHCREATHRNTLPVVVPQSIYTCIKAAANSCPFRVSNSNVRVADFTWHTPAFSIR
jgi:hypothetical protein